MRFQSRTVKVGMARRSWLRKCWGSTLGIVGDVLEWVGSGDEGRMAVGPTLGRLERPWRPLHLFSEVSKRTEFVLFCSFPLEPVFHDLRDRSAGERPSEGVFISEDNYGSWVGVLVWPISRLSPVPWVGSSTQEHVWLSMFRDHCGPFALAADRHFHM